MERAKSRINISFVFMFFVIEFNYRNISDIMLPNLSNPNQIYKIVSVADDQYCLDCSLTSSTLSQLIIYEHNSGNNQRWRIMSDHQGNYGFMNLENGGVLQIPFQSKGKEGTQCIVGAPIGNINEKWKIVPSGQGYAILSSLYPNLCVDINEQLTINENKVIIWPYSPNKQNQLWNFIPA